MASKINFRNVFVIFVAFALISMFGFVNAEEGHDALFAKAEEIISQNISCTQLGESDLEALGEYYMEQIHPGEQHEQMDAMMGGEGSENLRSMHINMGVRFYCIPKGEETKGISYSNSGMMGGGMMNNYYPNSGMMGNSYQGMMYGGYSFLWYLSYILFILVLILLIILLIKKINEPKKR